jgi:serine protease Do
MLKVAGTLRVPPAKVAPTLRAGKLCHAERGGYIFSHPLRVGFAQGALRASHIPPVLLAAIALCLFCSDLPAQDNPDADLNAALALERVLTRAIETAEPSVVAIARVRRGPQLGAVPRTDDGRLPYHSRVDPTDPDFVPNEYATGVVVGAAGLILTNYHVLGDPSQCDYYVWVQRRPYQARVKAEDPWMDLAVLEIEAEGLTPIVFGDTSALKKGQLVIVLGNPYAIARDGEASAARGIIANLHRPAPPLSGGPGASPSRPTLHHYGTLIQSDVKLLKGTSGGALLNAKGEMIGLTTSLAVPPGYEEAAGYAYPVNEPFLRTLENLKQGRKADYGFLGVAPIHLTALERRQGRFGARVQAVIRGAPAFGANLQEGDVITHVDGAPVQDANDLIRHLSAAPAAAEVKLTLQRAGGGRMQTMIEPATLSKKYIAARRPIIAEVDDPEWRGLRVDYATAIPQFDERAAAVDPQGCVAIVSVSEGSPAARAELRPRHFISHVESDPVRTPEQFYAAVAGRAGSVRIRLSEAIGGSNMRTIEE